MSEKIQFYGLTHAREFRDRRAAWAVKDLRRVMPEEQAQEAIDSICRAEGDWFTRICGLQEELARTWDGNGFPDWTYLQGMSVAISYIVEEERAACPSARV